jgi:hypothetical protein
LGYVLPFCSCLLWDRIPKAVASSLYESLWSCRPPLHVLVHVCLAAHIPSQIQEDAAVHFCWNVSPETGTGVEAIQCNCATLLPATQTFPVPLKPFSHHFFSIKTCHILQTSSVLLMCKRVLPINRSIKHVRLVSLTSKFDLVVSCSFPLAPCCCCKVAWPHFTDLLLTVNCFVQMVHRSCSSLLSPPGPGESSQND